MQDLDERERAPEREKQFVKVGCRVPGGIVLRLYRDGRNPDTGAPMPLPDGPAVTLNGPSGRMSGAGDTHPENDEPGVTEGVDRDWIEAVLKQRAGDPLVSTDQVFLIEEEEKPDDGAPE